MQRLKRLRAYFPFTLNVFQRILSYKANVLIFMMGEIMMLTVTYFLWQAIFASSPDRVLHGFTQGEMVLYVLVSFLTALITSVDITYDISREVKDGTIAINLIRPVSYEMRMLFQALGNVLYNFVVIFAGALAAVSWLFYKSTGGFHGGTLFFYFVSILLGIFINFYFSYAFGLLSFKITNMWGMSQIMQAIVQLFSGALIPLAFFPPIFQRLIAFLPFSSLIYTPTMIYLEKLTGEAMVRAMLLQVLWLFILMGVSRLLWKALVKNLTILGG